MATTPSTIRFPLYLGEAEIATIEVDLDMKVGPDMNVSVSADGLNIRVAEALRKAADHLHPKPLTEWLGGVMRRTVTSVDPEPEFQPMEWPTTPGSAVLAERSNGLGPQVLVLSHISDESVRPVWWGSHDDVGAPPREWTWNGAALGSGRVTLLQVLYVAP